MTAVLHSTSDLAPLSELERRRLADHERVIESGRRTFFDVGGALTEINRSRLYRGTHETFEDYCRDRWDFSRDWAYKQIRAVEVVSTLQVRPTSDGGQAVDQGLQVTERQARELAPLLNRPKLLRRAWDEASRDGEPTAAKVAAAVARTKTHPAIAAIDPAGLLAEASRLLALRSAAFDRANRLEDEVASLVRRAHDEERVTVETLAAELDLPKPAIRRYLGASNPHRKLDEEVR